MTTTRKAIFILIFALVYGCSNTEPVDDPDQGETPEDRVLGEIEEPLDDQPADDAEEADPDLTALIDQQLDTCNDLICERPFQCLEDAGELAESPQPAIDQCQREYCEVQRETLHELEPTEQLERCLLADEQATGWLEQVSCDDLIAFVLPDVPSDHVCPEEIAAQQEACAYYQQRVDRSSLTHLGIRR